MAAASDSGPVTLNAEDLQSLFKAIDTNGDNKVSLSEFCVLLARLGVSVSRDNATKLFNSADKDGSGSMDVAELQAFLASTPIESETGLAAGALRATLLAEYYALAAAKAMKKALKASSTELNTLDIKFAINEGISDKAGTTLTISASTDTSTLPESMREGGSSLRLDLLVAEGTDLEAIVTAFNEEVGGEELPFTVEAVTEGGRPVLRIAASMSAAEAMLGRSMPLSSISDMVSGGSLFASLAIEPTLSDLVGNKVCVPMTNALVDFRLTAPLSFLSFFTAMFTGSSKASMLLPTSVSISTGVNTKSYFEGKGISEEMLNSMFEDFPLMAILGTIAKERAGEPGHFDLPPSARTFVRAFSGFGGFAVKAAGLSIVGSISSPDLEPVESS